MGIMLIKQLSATLYKNLLAIALGQEPSNPIPRAAQRMALITLGPTQGILVVNGLTTMGEFGKRKIEATDLMLKVI